MRLVLVNMPFADWDRPSFALSQLAALTKREFPRRLSVEIQYLNVEFARVLGNATYKAIAEEVDHLMTGIGEWLFRRLAFPEHPDNTTEYFQRYYRGNQWAAFREVIIERRPAIEELCAELIDRHGLASADLVGFTSMFAQNVPSIALARLIKERNPDVLTLLGGANCEAPMGSVLAAQATAIDFVFSGPALHTFPEFLECVLDGQLGRAHAIPGIVTAENCQDAQLGTAIGRDRDVDDYLEPDYDGFVEAFSAAQEQLAGDQDVRPVLFFETSRGCWWGARSHCTFCGLNGLGMGYRAMSTETALRQFQRLFRFAPWCTTFSCTDNIMPKPYPREVFSRLVPPPNVSVFYEVKLPLSERDLRAMSAAQVNRVQPGVEALATDTLQLMGKGTTAFQNIQFLKNCIRYAIAAGWNLLIGFPGEKPEIYEKYAKDIPLLLHLPPPAGVYMVRFDRFSPYYTRASEFGLTLQPLDFYHLTYPFPAEDLEKMAYFFADQEISPYILDAVSWLGPLNELVEAWSRAWHERAVPPQLVLRDGDNGRREILDTRGQLPLVIEVNESEERLLRRLTSPAREERLATELDLPEVEMTGLLARFDERQLLFREGGQVLSLVLPAGGSAVESAIEAEPPETAIETEPHETAFVPVSAIGRPGSVEAAGNS